MRAMHFFLLTDAYGSNGGIAKFNRDFISAFIKFDRISELILWPRKIIKKESVPTENNMQYQTNVFSNAILYTLQVLKSAIENKMKGFKVKTVFCCHVNLLFPAALLSLFTKSKLILIIHGIEVWQTKQSWVKHLCLKRVQKVLAVSQFTKDKFTFWSGFDPEEVYIFPNCVEIEKYGIGPKSTELLQKYRLENKFVVMTLARLSSTERYKGIDEIIECIPGLLNRIPNLTYLIVGDGDDERRLKQKSELLGVQNHVVFCGFIEESQKPDYYRLADIFAMPGYGEGFGIVYLEAMACGIPVIGSVKDGSREALMQGRIGTLVDPFDPEQIKNAILKVFDCPEKMIPADLEYFSFQSFCMRLRVFMQALDK